MNKRLLQGMLAITLLVAISTSIYYRDKFNLELLQQWIDGAGWWAPFFFILVYIVATVLFLPGSVLTLAGGAMFGPVIGTLCNITGASIGAAISFLISRYLASDWVSKRSAGALKKLITGVEAEGWRFVAFTRLVPVFPFNLLNYALGLTKIRFLEYLMATIIFMLPGAIAYTYVGFAGREALSGGEGTIKTILIAIALLAVVMFLPRIISTMRRGPSIDITELKKRIDEKETLVLDVRSEKEFIADGHINDALNIPVDKLEQQINELDEHIAKSISIVCKTDKRSAIAANILIKHGYQNIRVVKGGMLDWFKEK